jgi:hypothetical protein
MSELLEGRVRCDCGAPATVQALFRHADGHHFLGTPVCEAGRAWYPLGRIAHGSAEIIGYMDVAG